MKKILYITSAVLALLAVSCAKVEVSDNGHEPGPKDVDGCYGVYFPTQEASGAHTYDPSQTPEVEITVGRKDRKGEITVPFKIISETPDVFTAGDIKFANGDSLTTVVVNFPNSEVGKNYSFTIKVDDPQYVSYYGGKATSLDFSVMRVEWKKFATGNLNVYGPLFTTGPKVYTGLELWYYEVDGTRTCKIVGGLPNLNASPAYNADYLFTWNAKTNRLYIPYQKIGYVEDGVDGYVSDAVGYYVAKYGEDYWAGSGSYANWTDYCEKNDLLFAEYDGNGAFYLADWYLCDQAVMSGYGWQFGAETVKDCDVFICDGFTRTDFEVKKIVPDYTQEGVVPVSVKTGRDAKALKYVTVEGELTATQAGKIVDAIADGTQEGVQESTKFFYDETEDANWFDFGFTFEKTGFYSIVAVVLNDGKVAGEGFESFWYVSKEDTEEYAVKVSAGVEDVPERYGLTNCEAFAYYVKGEELTDVHIATTTLAQFTKNQQAVLASVKGSDKYAVDEETLAAINGFGGYYDVVSELNADTDYVFVVWATNGSEDKFLAYRYTTEPLPYEWDLLGTGLFTDDTASPLYRGDPLTVPVNVYQEKTNKGLYKISGHALQICCAFFGVSEEVMRQYEGGNWRNSEIVIDASDPTSVIWELQDYGVCLNPDEGFIDGVTNMYQGKPFSKGTLSNGVISWPTPQGMLCTLNGAGYYYADLNGMQAIQLPSAVTAEKLEAAKAALKDFKPVKNATLIKADAHFNVCKSVKDSGNDYVREPKTVDCKVVNLSHKSAPKKDAPKKVRKFDATIIK